ncbi:MAG: acyl-CoA thioesterase [Selenomonadaceae bacterium]|nr:acyl-CoA thioesterase [Selenomonadaceae bacterium]
MSVKTTLRVHFYDTDEMGVVHHANYIRWFETGRVEYLRSIGITLTEMMSDGILFPITEVRAKYLNAAKFDDDLELETTALELTKVKMEFDYKIRRQIDGKILVKGYSQNVFTNAATGKISRLPEKYFSKLEKAMLEEMAQKNGNT